MGKQTANTVADAEAVVTSLEQKRATARHEATLAHTPGIGRTRLGQRAFKVRANDWVLPRFGLSRCQRRRAQHTSAARF
jgi:hypothetical protein